MQSKGFGSKVVDLFGSYGLACVLLGLLLLLTFLGTIEQTERGLYEVQRDYFESLFLVHWAFGTFPIPLPGVYLILLLLTVNLVVGGIIRIRKDANTIGILIAHSGILLMFAAGFVKMHFSDDGYLRLFHGQKSDEYLSYYEWELVIWNASHVKDVKELVVPDTQFASVGAKGRTFKSDQLPFDLVLSRYQRNSMPMPERAPMRRGGLPLVDGFALEPLPLAKEAEQNLPGVYVKVVDKNGGRTQDGIIWGEARHPLTVTSGGETWAIDLQKKRFKMPFAIQLDKFSHAFHPGTNTAKLFKSEVTKIENGIAQKHKIEMNEPLRHGGLVLFQASYGPADARPGDPNVFSVFAVVRNPSDQWPLISCIVIAIGLLIAFLQKLARYVSAQSAALAAQTSQTTKVPA